MSSEPPCSAYPPLLPLSPANPSSSCLSKCCLFLECGLESGSLSTEEQTFTHPLVFFLALLSCWITKVGIKGWERPCAAGVCVDVMAFLGSKVASMIVRHLAF